MYEIFASGGVVGLLIVFLSVGAVALAVKFALDLRRERILPREVAERLRDHISAGQLQVADEVCRAHPCPLSYVVSMGLQEFDGNWTDMEKTLEDALAEQSSKLFRKVEILSLIGNIAPMLGLLGTVLGMIAAFQQIAVAQGSAQGPELARGIYQALVTTVEGLVVAIPCIAMFAYFRSRVDTLMAEAAYEIQRIFLPLKRYRRMKSHVPAATSAAPSPPAPPKS